MPLLASPSLHTLEPSWGTGWEGESGSSKEEAPRLAELQVEKEKGWGATLPPMGGVGAKKKRAEWVNARKP